VESPTDRRPPERRDERQATGHGTDAWRVFLALFVAVVLYGVFGVLTLGSIAFGMGYFAPASCGMLTTVECPQVSKGLLMIAGGVLGLIGPAVLAVYIAGTTKPRRTAVISACLGLATWAALVGTAIGLAR